MLVRVHSECLTGDVFHSLRCDCGEQLESALTMIEPGGSGRAALPQPRRAVASGCSTSSAPTGCRRTASTRSRPTSASAFRPTCATTGSARRSSSTSASRRSGSSPTTRRRSAASRATGCRSAAQIPIEHAPNEHNEAYMRTKAERMGHTLHHQGLNLDEELLQRRARARPRAMTGGCPLSVRRRRRPVLRRPRRPARSRARWRRSVSGAEVPTSSTCPGRSSCRWRLCTRPGRVATPGSSASGP